jgi:hypothetical protein
MLVYCDYIAALLASTLDDDSRQGSKGIIAEVGKPMLDLNSDGQFLSTTKKVQCTDVFGRQYMITVEEIQIVLAQ